MAEYQVPQFIEVEDKIFGPLTFRQFIYVAGGGSISVALVLYLHVIGLILALPIVALSLALAFYKINNKTFSEILEAGFNYYLGGRLYLWKKDKAAQKETVVAAPTGAETRQKLGLSSSKLHELSWSLDVQDRQNPQNT